MSVIAIVCMLYGYSRLCSRILSFSATAVLLVACEVIVAVMVCMTGGVFSKTEMSEVLTEVVRMDPTFDKEEFIKLCRFDVIPNILEVNKYLCAMFIFLFGVRMTSYWRRNQIIFEIL